MPQRRRRSIGRQNAFQVVVPVILEPIVQVCVFFLKIQLHPGAVSFIILVEPVDPCRASIQQVEGFLERHAHTLVDMEFTLLVLAWVLLVLVRSGKAIKYISPLFDQFEKMELDFSPDKMIEECIGIQLELRFPLAMLSSSCWFSSVLSPKPRYLRSSFKYSRLDFIKKI